MVLAGYLISLLARGMMCNLIVVFNRGNSCLQHFHLMLDKIYKRENYVQMPSRRMSIWMSNLCFYDMWELRVCTDDFTENARRTNCTCKYTGRACMPAVALYVISKPCISSER